MKAFRTLVVVRQPADVMFAAVRDRLTELVPMIDDVAAISELERQQLAPERTRLVNEWRAVQRIPDFLVKALDSSQIGWIDRNEWDADALACHWSIEPFVLSEHIECHGATVYEPAMGGRGARVTVTGSFDLTEDALAGLGGALQRPVGAFIESIVTTMIPKNSRKVIEAAAGLVAAEISR